MNEIVSALRETPTLIDELATAESVHLAALGRLLWGDDAEAVLDTWQDDPLLARQLSEAYLVVLPRRDWDDSISQASRRKPVEAPEWVTFVSGSSERGLTLPQDASSEPSLSLFARFEGSVRRVSVEARFRNSPWNVSVSFSTGHCELPDRGRCDPGRCGGCLVRVREAVPRGLVCVCSHS